MIWFKTMYMYMDNIDCRHSHDPGNGCLPCSWWWLCTRPWRRFWTPCLQWCAPLHGSLCTSLHVHLECGSFFLILLNETINKLTYWYRKWLIYNLTYWWFNWKMSSFTSRAQKYTLTFYFNEFVFFQRIIELISGS